MVQPYLSGLLSALTRIGPWIDIDDIVPRSDTDERLPTVEELLFPGGKDVNRPAGSQGTYLSGHYAGTCANVTAIPDRPIAIDDGQGSNSDSIDPDAGGNSVYPSDNMPRNSSAAVASSNPK